MKDFNESGNSLVITNGKVLLPDGELKSCDVLIENGYIKELGTGFESEFQIDARGSYVLPGLIDLHTHGIYFESVETGNPKEYARIEASCGVTTVYPTFATSPDKMVKHLKRFRQETDELRAVPQIGGFRLETPYLACTGAAKSEELARIQPETTQMLMKAGGGHIRIWDISPELKGMSELIRELTGSGIVCSIAHSQATIEQSRDAVDAGARLVTHMFNVLSMLETSELGVYPVGLNDYFLTEDRLTCEIIPDGTHVHPLLVEKAFRCKTPERIAFITDSDFGAGLAPGTYKRPDSGEDIVVNGRNNGLRMVGREMCLAGSALTPIDAFRSAIDLFHKDIYTASQICSKTPARIMGLNKGEIAVGKDADIIIVDTDFQILYTTVAGTIVYKKDK